MLNAKKSLLVIMLLVCSLFLVSAEANAKSFLDKINDILNPMGNKPVNQPSNIPGSQIPGNVVTGDPETMLSEKALEAMAALGDPWARLKLEEIRAKKFSDLLYQRYKAISWFNIFSKLDAYSAYKNAKNVYTQAAERSRQFELANPNSGGIIQGIDQISESVLEFKALFGDKKAKAQLELIRAKREYTQIKYQYDSASLFDKLKFRDQLNYAKARYELALQNYAIVAGKAPQNVPPQVAVPQVNQNQNQGNVNTQQPNVNNQTPYVDPAKNAALKFVRDRVDASYKRYTMYMSTPNPDPQVLKQYETEYLTQIEEYKRISGGPSTF
jgi:hypothetical protein